MNGFRENGIHSFERGAAVVEFAFVVIILVALLIGIFEFGRALFMWNSAVEATRRGARTAAIVQVGDPGGLVLTDMQHIMGMLTPDNVIVEYSADGSTFSAACVAGTCQFVRVSIVGYTFEPLFFPVAIGPIPLPPFSTTLPVEALGTG